MKKRYYIIIALVILTVFGYQYLFHDKRNINTEKPSFILNASVLNSYFIKDNARFNEKYLDKTIQINGNITELDVKGKAIIIDSTIFATFEKNIDFNLKINQKVIIKARFIGYDDLLENFKFDQTTIIK